MTLEYEVADRPVRPRLWLSHMITASALCLLTLLLDAWHGLTFGDGDQIIWIEWALAIYAGSCVCVSLNRGGLTRGDKIAVGICSFVVLTGLLGGALMPRVIHN